MRMPALTVWALLALVLLATRGHTRDRLQVAGRERNAQQFGDPRSDFEIRHGGTTSRTDPWLPGRPT